MELLWRDTVGGTVLRLPGPGTAAASCSWRRREWPCDCPTALPVSALTCWHSSAWLPGVKPKEAEERQQREGNETTVEIKPANTNIPLGDQWGARCWNNCCQPAARRVTSCFTKASNEHKKKLNPPPEQMKGLEAGGMERRSEHLLKKNHYWTCSCTWVSHQSWGQWAVGRDFRGLSMLLKRWKRGSSKHQHFPQT